MSGCVPMFHVAGGAIRSTFGEADYVVERPGGGVVTGTDPVDLAVQAFDMGPL